MPKYSILLKSKISKDLEFLEPKVSLEKNFYLIAPA